MRCGANESLFLCRVSCDSHSLCRDTLAPCLTYRDTSDLIHFSSSVMGCVCTHMLTVACTMYPCGGGGEGRGGGKVNCVCITRKPFLTHVQIRIAYGWEGNTICLTSAYSVMCVLNTGALYGCGSRNDVMVL